MTSQKATQYETVYKCEACDEITDNPAGPLYECSDCGTKFNRDNSADGASHRCPECNKFGTKIADKSCGECGEGEVPEIQAYFCEPCDQWVEAGEEEEHEKENHGEEEPEEAAIPNKEESSYTLGSPHFVHYLTPDPSVSVCSGPVKIVEDGRNWVRVECLAHGKQTEINKAVLGKVEEAPPQESRKASPEEIEIRMVSRMKGVSPTI